MSAGVVYLMAGAGPSTSRSAVRFHKDCARATGKRRPRIAYVGAAANDNKAFAAMLRTLVFGVTANVVNVELSRKRLATSALKETLGACDLVFFTGGDVERGMELVNERGLAPYFRELSAQGVPLEGISAGSIMLGKHWVRFPEDGDDKKASAFECLGIVPASFDTHAEADGWDELIALARVLPEDCGEEAVYGIPSGGCAVWDGRVLRAEGLPLVRFKRARVPTRLADLPAAAPPGA